MNTKTVLDAAYDQTKSEVLAEIERACVKFPAWPRDPLHAIAVLNEEVGELNKAVLQEVYEPVKQDRNAVHDEAVQAAAMAFRFLTHLIAETYEFRHSAMKDAYQPDSNSRPGSASGTGSRR